MALGDNDNTGDGVYEALEAMDTAPPVVDVQRAVTRLRAHGFGTEANVLLGRGDAAWAMLRTLRDALRRTDPAWCKLHRQEQILDEDLEAVIGTLEDLLEDGPSAPHRAAGGEAVSNNLEQLQVLRAERLAAKAAAHRERRERIATAALQGMLADPNGHFTTNGYATGAVVLADALIAELDKPKEVKP